ncbi:MAG: histidine kinase [Sphingomonas bacterium]|uniref:sensor histidine kinase n=1 Tax=Sphingomonas bacterium TaxID=1895847 RepID=UPI00262D44AC|nr:HAMP domain-containing sensor histidine kinase [Sphingomonas bacterium]MDB5704182.1 histidine kinase [Sphingomonas bacterium]
MRLVPRSLYGRLLLASIVATLAALALAAVAIGAVLERFVMQGLDQRLDAQIAVLAAAVKPDGTIDRGRIVILPPADRHEQGGGWWIETDGRFTIGSLPQAAIATLSDPANHPPDPGRHRRDHRERDDASRPQPFDGRIGSHGYHGRRLSVPTDTGTVTITAVAPRAIVERPIRAAKTPLLGSLLLLGLALAAATLVQLRIGLHPLRRLGDAIGAVRAGTATQVSDDQPTELQPLARELNALLGENEAALANARGHVANLAHGLKTPLATLALGLRDPARDPDGTLGREVARIDHAIRHHLGRARAGTPGGAARLRTALAPALDGLIEALGRIHADRGIAVERRVAPGLALAIDPQDLDEMLGNLLDNAWRWAAHRILIEAGPDADGRARIAIEDDGPGIPADGRAAALVPGRRLDERGDGHGFGLSIVRELAELYGGTLTLDSSPSGGLAAIVRLALAGSRQDGVM